MNQYKDLGLRDYAGVVRRRWRALVSIGALGLVVALGLSLVQTQSYEASAQVLVQYESTDPLQQQPAALEAQRQLNNEIRQMESSGARDYVHVGYTGALDVKKVSVAIADSASDVLSVKARANNAQATADLVNAYVERYIEYRRQIAVESLLASAGAVQKQMDDVQKSLSNLTGPIAVLDVQITATSTPADVERLRAERNRLAADPQIASYQSQLAFYQQQLDKVQLSANIRKSNGMRVLRSAEVPSSPVAPKPVRNALLGLVAGLVLGLAAIFLLEQLDDSIDGRDTLELLTGLTVLGSIPTMVSTRKQPLSEIVLLQQPRSATAEAFRTLRTSLKFVGVNRVLCVIQVTSASAGDGKTVVSANMAVAMAQAGERVILVGCDLRRPRLDAMTGAPTGPGLTEVLVGEIEAQDAIWSHPDVEGLDVMRTGTLPPNPSELLGSPAANELFARLAESYDAVVLDCAPVLPVADALVVAGYADATLVVVSQGSTHRSHVLRALDTLRQVNAKVVGVVLNQTGRGDSYEYAYAAPVRTADKRTTSKDGPSAEASGTSDVGTNGNRPRAKSALSAGAAPTEAPPKSNDR